MTQPRHRWTWTALLLSAALLAGCGEDTETPIEPDPDPTPEPSAELPVKTATINAADGESWAYFSFINGEVEPADAENSTEWDLGFQRTKVKLNGGVSGPGEGAAILLDETSFDEVSAAPGSGYAVDSADALAIIAQSEMGWYIYTGPPTHWILPIENRVFVVKAADGTYAKIRFTGYYKDNENKMDSGHVSFEYVHQPDGSLNF